MAALTFGEESVFEPVFEEHDDRDVLIVYELPPVAHIYAEPLAAKSFCGLPLHRGRAFAGEDRDICIVCSEMWKSRHSPEPTNTNEGAQP